MNVQNNNTTENPYAKAGFPANNLTALLVQKQLAAQDSESIYQSHVTRPEINKIFEAQRRGA